MRHALVDIVLDMQRAPRFAAAIRHDAEGKLYVDALLPEDSELASLFFVVAAWWQARQDALRTRGVAEVLSYPAEVRLRRTL